MHLYKKVMLLQCPMLRNLSIMLCLSTENFPIFQLLLLFYQLKTMPNSTSVIDAQKCCITGGALLMLVFDLVGDTFDINSVSF